LLKQFTHTRSANAPEESLDPALLRPGRFDRIVYIGKPGLEERERVFDYYLKKVKCASDIDSRNLARKAVGKSPADIECIVKEAALIATRKEKESISYKEISEAIERIELGIKNKIKMTPREKEMTAYHESGHLIATYLLHPRKDVFKASLIPRKASLGVVHPASREEWFTEDKESIMADIKIALAGYVGEKIKYGTTSSGVTSDFQMAMRAAHMMVWRIGMGSNGFVGDYTAIPKDQMSESLKERLNQETSQILEKCLHDVETLLRTEKEIHERFAHELLTKQELEYDEIEAIFNEYGKPNPRIFAEEQAKKADKEKSTGASSE